jgi:hypothetical protein
MAAVDSVSVGSTVSLVVIMLPLSVCDLFYCALRRSGFIAVTVLTGYRLRLHMGCVGAMMGWAFRMISNQVLDLLNKTYEIITKMFPWAQL